MCYGDYNYYNTSNSSQTPRIGYTTNYGHGFNSTSTPNYNPYKPINSTYQGN